MYKIGPLFKLVDSLDGLNYNYQILLKRKTDTLKII